MSTIIRGWTPTELDHRAAPLTGLVRRAWRLVAARVYDSLLGVSHLSVDDVGGVTREWLQQVKSPLIMGYVRRQLLDAGAHARRDLGDVTRALDVFETPGGPDLVRDYLRGVVTRLGGVGDDVWLAARETLVTGLQAGVSSDELTLRVRAATGVSLGRARRIALTEVHAAHEAGTHAQVLLLDPDATKTWDAKLDEATRSSHREVDGETLKLTETFRVGGYDLRFPGDPFGPPHETVFCRCRLAYTVSSLDMIETVTASDKSDDEQKPSFDWPSWDEWQKQYISAWQPTYEELSKQQVIAAADDHWKDQPRAPAGTGKAGQWVKSKIFAEIPLEPTGSPSKIVGHKGKKPGEVAKVTTTLVWGKHQDGQVVLIRQNTRIRWSTPDKKYLMQARKPDGTWFTVSMRTKKDLYEQQKNEQTWLVPTDLGGLPETTSSSPPQATLATPPTVAPGQKPVSNGFTKPVTPLSSPPVFGDFAGFTKVGGQQGSNLGGWFRDEDGDRLYVKKAKSDDHAANEVLAANLYALADVDTPQITRGYGAPGIGGGLQTATPEVKNGKANLKQKLGHQAYLDQLREGFAVDAWLANWDVAGLAFDNVIEGEVGQPVRIDVGGALLYRAMGAPKGKAFGDTVSEIDTLMDPKMNPQSAQIFGSMTYDEIRESAKRLLPITPEMIDAEVATAGFAGKSGQDLAERLRKRRQDILERFDLDLDEQSQVTPGAPGSKIDWKSVDLDAFFEGELVAMHANGKRRVVRIAGGFTVERRNIVTDEWQPAVGGDSGNLTSLMQTQSKYIGDDWHVPTADEKLDYEGEQIDAAQAHFMVPVPAAPESTEEVNLGYEPHEQLDGSALTELVESALNIGLKNEGHIFAVSDDGQWRLTFSSTAWNPLQLERWDAQSETWKHETSYDPGHVTDEHLQHGTPSLDDTLGIDTNHDVTAWITPDSQLGSSLLTGKISSTGGSDLTYAPEDIIGDWNAIASDAGTLGEPVALSADGSFRVTWQPSGFMIQQWTDTYGPFQWLNLEFVKPTQLENAIASGYPGVWLLPKSTGYETKTPGQVDPDDWVVLPDGTPNWTAITMSQSTLTPGQTLAVGKSVKNADAKIEYVGGAKPFQLLMKSSLLDTWVPSASSKNLDTIAGLGSGWQGVKATESDPLNQQSVSQPVVPEVTGMADISSVPVSLQKSWKKQLGDSKVGYWSKPEKIWTEVAKVVKAHDGQYTSLQVIKALDAQTKTKDPDPFTGKMTKWAQTAKGAAAIQGSLAETKSTSQNYVGYPLVGGDADVDVDALLQQGVMLSPGELWSLAETLHSPAGTVLAYRQSSVAGGAQQRLDAALSPTGEMQVRISQYINGEWHAYGSIKHQSEFSPGWVSALNAPKKGVASTTQVAPTPAQVTEPQAGQLDLGDGSISHLTQARKQKIFDAFKMQGNPGLTSKNSKIWDALQTIMSETGTAHGASTLQVLRAIDEISALKVKNPNENLFEKKIVDWLATPQGYAYATKQPVPLPPTPQFHPSASANGIEPLEKSNARSYPSIPVQSTQSSWDEAVSKSAPWTVSQRAAVRAYTGGIYHSINAWLSGRSDHLDVKAQKKATQIQLAMRPSTRPMTLHRGTNLKELGVGSHEALEKLKGQVRRGHSFRSTNVGDGYVWSGSLRMVIEAPPGTPMAWVGPGSAGPASTAAQKAVSQYPHEKEMILAAGLDYQITSVWQEGGYSYVRVRVVPRAGE